jgi:hypothetical protein
MLIFAISAAGFCLDHAVPTAVQTNTSRAPAPTRADITKSLQFRLFLDAPRWLPATGGTAN